MGLLSNVYKNSKVGQYAGYNASYGVPLAVNTALSQNRNVANQGAALTGEINRLAAEEIAKQLQELNSRNSEWSADQAIDLNRTASEFSTNQAISQNRKVSDAASSQADKVNQAARDAATQSAKASAEELNLFSTLNSAFLNNSIAVPAANKAASGLNQSATQDVLNSQAQMFGGKEQFDQFRNQVNQNLADMLSGQVSQSTRRQLSRRAISSGNTELGGGSVDDAYTGYLGLTSEQLKSQGQQQYQSLYGLYRQSVPITSGAQLLPQFALSNSQISSQAQNVANQQAQLGSISTQQLTNMSGVSNGQLLSMSGVNQGQLYGTNALSASQMYGTNSLSNSAFFGTNSVSGSQIAGLTTITPAQGIALELQAASLNARNQRNGNSRNSSGSSNGNGQAQPSPGRQSFQGLKNNRLHFGTPFTGVAGAGGALF